MTDRPLPPEAENLLRQLAPQVLGATVRRFGDFAAAEDAVQEALISAAAQWPSEGTPANPRGWLIRVAARRMADHVRGEIARRAREANAAGIAPLAEREAADEDATAEDDTLVLLFMCCHPAVTAPSAIALTLRAVGGLTTAEIARAFLVPEATMAQRISRAKQTIRSSGVPFELPDPDERPARLRSVLHVLYLIFNEGYAAGAGPELLRADLSNEAIRLARILHASTPSDPEAEGLVALLLLTDARRAARTGPEGELIPLDQQDRALWNHAAITEGAGLLNEAMARGAIGPYQLQAAIAAAHDLAARPEDTSWREILELYGLLRRMDDNPMVALSHAVAVAMVHGPQAGLNLVRALDEDARLSGHYRLDAVRGHLLELAGDLTGAVASYRRAAERTCSVPERAYLTAKAARLV